MAESVIKNIINTSFSVDNVVDVTSYTSANPYTFPSDGYLSVFAGSTTGDLINVRISENFVADSYCYTANMYTTSNLFVKKGMQAYVLSNTGGRGRARFYPISQIS